MDSSFDIMAEQFDTKNRIERAQFIANRIKNEIDFSKITNVMDFGCGTGLITFSLIDSLQNITLIDSSNGMLSVVTEKINKLGIKKNIKVINSINSDELLIDSYDCIYSSMVLHHINNISGINNRFYSLLRRNGFLCIVDLAPVDELFHKSEVDFNGYNGFDPKKLSTQIQKHGFKEIENKEIYVSKKIIEDKEIDYSLFMLILQKI